VHNCSKLFPGTRLVHGDLHNHTLLSDGAGNPELAFETMRRSGMDRWYLASCGLAMRPSR
jgi:hypothetical protein